MISSFRRGTGKLMKEFNYLIGLHLDYSHLFIKAYKKIKFYILIGGCSIVIIKVLVLKKILIGWGKWGKSE